MRAHRTPRPARDAGAGRTWTAAVSSRLMAVQAWFVQDDMTVRPGTSASLSVVVENVGDRTESYTIIPAGLSAAWTTVTRPNVTLFGGSRDVVEVTVRPPAIPTTTSGPTVRVGARDPAGRPRRDARSPRRSSPSARSTTVGSPCCSRCSAGDGGRPTSSWSTTTATTWPVADLHLIDASGRVDGTFDPPAVGVAPGSSSLVRLKLRARRSFFRRAERQVDFEIEATEPEHDPATGRATLIQPPTIPARTIGRVALAAGRHRGRRRRLVLGRASRRSEDAADRAVDERVDEFAPAALDGRHHDDHHAAGRRGRSRRRRPADCRRRAGRRTGSPSTSASPRSAASRSRSHPTRSS